jgi:HlyD family secretion protein
MQLPLMGKVSKSTIWLIALALVGLSGLSIAIYLAVLRATAPLDINALTVPVQEKNLAVRITESGTVVPIQTVNLSPKTSGRIAQLYVEQGDKVKSGEVIARMESRDIEAQRVQAKANIAQAQARLKELQVGNRPEEIAQAQATVVQNQAQVADAQARLNLARERVTRNQALASEGAISRDQLDAVLNEERTARAGLERVQASVREAEQRLQLLRKGTRPEQIAQAAAAVAEAKGRLQAIEVQQEDTLVRAPFSGVVTQKYATVGAFVTPTTTASSTSSATSTSIVALANGLEVLAKVPEVDLSQVKLGQPVEIVADAYPDKTFRGQVRLIAPEAVVQQDVTSFEVRVTIKTGLALLRSRMNVDATFLGKQLNHALVIPTVAVVTQQGQTGVMIPDAKGKAQFRPVTLGSSIGNQTQILKGVKPGERVFVDLPKELENKQ